MKLPSTYVYIPLPNAIPSLYQIIFFTVQGSECSNTWLLQILRTNDCWVLSPKRGHDRNIAIRPSQQFCLLWGRNNTGLVSSQSWMGRDSLGATVSQELLAVGESLGGCNHCLQCAPTGMLTGF